MSQTPPGFSVKARDGNARCGTLVTRTGSIDTPSVLLYTRRGGPLSLTSPDMLAAVTPPVQGVQLSVMQFMENPDAATLRQYGRGAQSFLALGPYPVLASNRDPTMYEFGTRPSSEKEVHVCIHSGGHMVGPARYMDTVAALQPDLFVTLCDEITADSRSKRIATSARRTAAWLSTCLELAAQHSQPRQQQEQQEPAEQQKQQQEEAGAGTQGAAAAAGQEGDAAVAGPLAGSLALAALTGGALPAERTRAAKAVGDRSDVAGYAICGLGTGEDPAQRPALIAASLEGLGLAPEAAAARVVFASGVVGGPDELLEAVAAGVDLMDCGFVAQVTTGGYALTFPLRPPQGWQPGDAPSAAGAGAGGADVALGSDDTKMNLWSTAYRLDKGPLLPGCGCFACARHSRAYVHHLLNAHEMLGEVLLEAHNTSHMNGFCQAIREAIAEGRFEQYRAWFRSLRSSPLVDMTPPGLAQAAKRRASGPAGEDAGVKGAEDRPADAEAPAEGAGSFGGKRPAGRAKWVRV
ncbi:hypothetical protein CHLRE_10g451000v5 [Chlamydomonas reinhardtii]|uniref:Queuine tRNA-ribosyltransferase accessory subunit 2 n=1 Tax=Chlamydomonas reinhardtii TaxID=3055 RepID=A0A2K3DB64_CHLRE|nr:uncharacterized protein CHLRE_10g451000v5 [Chlamydomonas reinhardtii]PNW77771.1 hypothetical protein CHLRE_10g451000v5 [Chlamydomonas reinhardtii]